MAQKVDPKMQKDAERFIAEMQAKAAKSILSQCKLWRVDLRAMEASWTTLDKLRTNDKLITWTLEVAGGAKFPPKSDLKMCEHWIYNVENGVEKGYNKRLPIWIKNAESSLLTTDAAIKTYVSRLDRGGDITVGSLKVAKGAGMVAVGVLAAQFAAPSLVAKLAIEGTITGAVVTGSTASVISKNVDIVATTIGRVSAGEKLDAKKEFTAAINGNIEAALTGMFTGALGKGLKAGIVGPIFKKLPINKLDDEAATQVTRLGVGGFSKFLKEYFKNEGKKDAPAAAKKASKRIKGKQSEDAVMLIMLEEATKSPKFQKALVAYAKKNAKSK